MSHEITLYLSLALAIPARLYSLRSATVMAWPMRVGPDDCEEIDGQQAYHSHQATSKPKDTSILSEENHNDKEELTYTSCTCMEVENSTLSSAMFVLPQLRKQYTDNSAIEIKDEAHVAYQPLKPV